MSLKCLALANYLKYFLFLQNSIMSSVLKVIIKLVGFVIIIIFFNNFISFVFRYIEFFFLLKIVVTHFLLSKL